MTFDDYNEITRRRYEYAVGIDTHDWALLRSIFTDEITMDFSSYSGQPSATTTADDWVAGCKLLFMGLDATQHVMTNPIVDVDGDVATQRMYMKAEHFLQNDQGSPDFALAGYYDDKLIRTSDGWRIEAVTLTILWNRGNRHIMELAMARPSREKHHI
ncbi:MAG: nuclear transport factor 2 family protein [Alphaproteobacteria bacterium]|nr:MAG: nuclear transport factor 2 family protein [Alphaproteobacteria bacterium]